MRVLITGSDGFAGTHLTWSLEGDGHTVTGFTRRRGADVRDYLAVHDAVATTRPDLIFHLAAVSSPAEARQAPRRAVDTAVAGTLNVLDAARAVGCGTRILVAGSSDEYGPGGAVLTEDSPCRPQGPYGAAKLAATGLAMAWAQAYGTQVVVTRAFMHTGPGHRSSNMVSGLARQVAAVERGTSAYVVHGDLDAAVDLTDVWDVVQAYRLAIGLDSGIYNVCSGVQVALRDILGILTGMASRAVPLKADPAPWHGQAPPATCGPLAAAGWKPQIPLEETLASVLNYWRAQ